MKILASKVLALGGLCALFAGAGNVAFAQGDNHQGNDNQGQNGQYRQGDHRDRGQMGQRDYGQNRQYRDQGQNGQFGQDQYRQSDQYRQGNRDERRRLDRLHQAYARRAARGDYSAAERAHLHAEAIRAQLRARHGDDHRDRH